MTKSTQRRRLRRKRYLRIYDELNPIQPEAGALYPGLQPGHNLAEFVYERRLGEGGQATVVRVRQRGTEIRFALRIAKRPPELSRPEYERQLKLLQPVRHAGIPRHHRVSTLPGGYVYLQIDFVPGQSICSFARRLRLTIRKRLHLFERLCRAVESLHGAGIIHCDLKPGNVLVTPNSRPFLLDFGSILLQGDPVPDSHPGTRHYRSPERLTGCNAEQTIDVFSLGAILYELLIRYPPFARHAAGIFEPLGDSVAMAMQQYEPESPTDLLTFHPESLCETCKGCRRGERSLRRALAKGLDGIARRAVAKSPVDRYPNVKELRHAIRACRLP